MFGDREKAKCFVRLTDTNLLTQMCQGLHTFYNRQPPSGSKINFTVVKKSMWLVAFRKAREQEDHPFFKKGFIWFKDLDEGIGLNSFWFKERLLLKRVLNSIYVILALSLLMPKLIVRISDSKKSAGSLFLQSNPRGILAGFTCLGEQNWRF